MMPQKHTNATKTSAYSHRELKEKLSQAKSCRRRLAGLPVDSKLRDYLVEPIAAVENHLKELIETEKS